MNTLTYERLHEVLSYTPFDGLFRWKIEHPTIHIKIGDIAGHKIPGGYIQITVDCIQYSAHRLAWFYVYGYWPENNIDHKFRIKYDNRIRRLREISSLCDIRNRGCFKNNKSGVTGVTWNKSNKRWHSFIYVAKINKHLGAFKDFSEAVCHRLAAEQCLNWEKCNLNSPAYQYVKEMLG